MRIRRKKKFIVRLVVDALLLCLLATVVIYRQNIRQLVTTGTFRRETIRSIQVKYGSGVEAKLKPLSESMGITWPPKRTTLIALKTEKTFEVWVSGSYGPYRLLKTYPIARTSGHLGPKRLEGDGQVPEGFYDVAGLNPNSQFHLSIKINYPNSTDIRNSKVPKNEMGGDIFIHGSNVTIGCLPLGDENIEEVFYLLSLVPPESRKVIIAPVDLRQEPGFVIQGEEPWVNELYRQMAHDLGSFKDD